MLKGQSRALGGRRLLRAALGYFAMGISLAIAQASSPLTGEPQALFIDSKGPEEARASTDPTIVRTRPVRVNVDLFVPLVARRGDKLRLNLFDDISFVAVFERCEVRSPSSYTWFGRLANEEYSSFILVVEQGVMAANIRVPGKGVYQIGFLGAGVHVIREIDESKIPPCGVGNPEGMGAQVAPVPCGGPNNGCVDDGSQIDVLVVYTAAARVGAGGTAAINASIQLAIDTANEVYTNSLINTQLNLVLAAEIDYDESEPFPLLVLRNPNDGVLDEVPVLRDEVHADLVSLIVEDLPGLAGVAEQMVYIQPVENFGYSVVGRPFLSVFTHELGHNMGCAHERVGTNAGFFEYSFGYSFVGDSGRTWGTAMGPGLRIPHFSNPSVLFDGQPTGIPAGEPDSADNARTINETALIIANIRPSVPPDCNGNGIGDDEDIANETSDDENNDGIPDECEITLHVDAGAAPGGDGTSWADAYNDLQDAILNAACPCSTVTEIWVAAGTYTPDRGTGNRRAAFNLLNFAIYGGFAGNEGTFAERAGLFEKTILSGDLNGDDGPDFQNNDENSYTVVLSLRTDARAVLDGFTITAGNADNEEPLLTITSGGGVIIASGSLTLRHCRIIGNSAEFGGGIRASGAAATLVNCTINENKARIGGGMFAWGTPRLINCEFSNNSAEQGGGLYLQRGTALLANCVFHGNTSFFGAGLFIQETEATVINSTFSMNSAASRGGGVYLHLESTLTLRNSVLWDNTDTAGVNSNETAQIFDEPAFGVNVVSVEYSCVQDEDPDDANVYPGTGNIDDDPLFVDAEGSDLNLLPGSPSIDAARNNAVSLDVADLDGDGDTEEPVPFDFDGNPRFVDDPNTDDCPQPGADCGTPPIVDMGACEFRDGSQLIPTVSEWGLVVMTLLVLTLGTLILAGRRPAGRAM